MTLCIRRCNYKSKHPFMHEHIRQNKNETVLIAQEELHVQKSSHILRVNHNSAEAITKINLYLCGPLIYIEKQILSGSKLYISLHLCPSSHLFQSNRVCLLSTSPPCTGLEWSEKNNYSRIVTLVSMQRQTSVLNGVMEPLFLCVRQSREYVSSRHETNLLKLGSFLNIS